jgi:polysaccharide pyruvyl transferase WcaK-like protein
MNFLLVGYGGNFNRGCEAILRSTLLMLFKKFINPYVVVSSFNYNIDNKSNLSRIVKFIPAELEYMWSRFHPHWFLRKLVSALNKKESWTTEYQPIKKYLNSTDIVLSVGGDNYTMDYEYPDHFLNLNNFIKKSKKKLVIWGASIGPFPDDKELKIIINNLKQVDLITVRESLSFEYLKKIGVSDNVRLVSDPAFILPLDSQVYGDTHLTNKKLLGFNISQQIAQNRKSSKNGNTLEECIDFLKIIIKETDLDILLVPHVINFRNSNNDHEFMKEILRKLSLSGRISLISPKNDAMQIKFIISKCKYFIGARTHSTIAALSSGVPTLSISYSTKAVGINMDIFGSDSYVIDSKNFNAENLKKKFLNIINNEETIRDILAASIPKMQALAWNNVDYLLDFIKMSK